ncbi:hypothetical protein Ahy_B06g085908 [Arachis hypogaea]|uniref:Transposase MuDR plant domain-containing protein n=1 Tax=Arachis hypogaea TaxID=3818 RepID=A0A444YW19_ARAHY|nr:hypothetical protein Ahy_B06g085908 [Arachis hypogaea]
MNDDSDEEFKATYEASDEDEDGDGGGEAVAKTLIVPATVSQSMDVPPFMCSLDFDAMHVPEFLEYANIVIAAIQSFTISTGVDYVVYESEPQTFDAKCKTYGRGCDCLIQASLIQKKACWEIRKYNGRHTCSMGTISQDHSKLDSDMIAEAMKPLVESDPSINVKSIIAEPRFSVDGKNLTRLCRCGSWRWFRRFLVHKSK